MTTADSPLLPKLSHRLRSGVDPRSAIRQVGTERIDMSSRNTFVRQLLDLVRDPADSI